MTIRSRRATPFLFSFFCVQFFSCVSTNFRPLFFGVDQRKTNLVQFPRRRKKTSVHLFPQTRPPPPLQRIWRKGVRRRKAPLSHFSCFAPSSSSTAIPRFLHLPFFPENIKEEGREIFVSGPSSSSSFTLHPLFSTQEW